MKYLLWLILLIGLEVKAQLPGPVIGTAVAIPAGSFNCTQSTFPAPVGVSNEGDPVTMCFNYYNIGPINLSYLLVNGLCGPFPLYNSLSFQIFDSTGTQFITSGTIVPIANNITITSLTPSTYYTICYTWVPNCLQFSGCPLIYTSALPIELLYFNGEIKDNNVILKWATATETNVDKFIIEKTYDAITFTTVAEIKVEGNSTNTNFYETIDYNETNELVYYKLVEVTIEGQRIDQSIIVVNRKNQNIPSQIFDITGKELNDYKSGFNIVRQGEKYYKIIKL